MPIVPVAVSPGRRKGSARQQLLWFLLWCIFIGSSGVGITV